MATLMATAVMKARFEKAAVPAARHAVHKSGVSGLKTDAPERPLFRLAVVPKTLTTESRPAAALDVRCSTSYVSHVAVSFVTGQPRNFRHRATSSVLGEVTVDNVRARRKLCHHALKQ
jgi:hypothetical protein